MGSLFLCGTLYHSIFNSKSEKRKFEEEAETLTVPEFTFTISPVLVHA